MISGDVYTSERIFGLEVTYGYLTKRNYIIA